MVALISLPWALLPADTALTAEPALVGIAPPARLHRLQVTAEPVGEPADIATVPRALRQAVVTDAARRFGVAESAVVVFAAEHVTWPDGSLGCPKPGMRYTQMLVPGYRLTARTAERELRYHTDARAQVVLCDAAIGASGKPALQPGKGVAPRTRPPAPTAPDR